MAKLSKKRKDSKEDAKSSAKSAILGVVGRDAWKSTKRDKPGRRRLLKLGAKLHDASSETTREKLRGKIRRTLEEARASADDGRSSSEELDTGTDEDAPPDDRGAVRLSSGMNINNKNNDARLANDANDVIEIRAPVPTRPAAAHAPSAAELLQRRLGARVPARTRGRARLMAPGRRSSGSHGGARAPRSARAPLRDRARAVVRVAQPGRPHDAGTEGGGTVRPWARARRWRSRTCGSPPRPPRRRCGRRACSATRWRS
jgi:hypothetical protein